LAFPAHEWERLRRAKERLSQQISEKRRIALEADAAVVRLQRQRRLVENKLRAIGDRELQNIQEMEIDELISGVPLLEGEDPTDPSLALLGSAGNIPAEPLSS
jgi:hypothetical protein